MTDDIISKKVLIDLINNWRNIEKYYHPDNKTPKDIPISEVIEIIQECPTVGADVRYIKGKRFEHAFNLGKKEVINEIHKLLNKVEAETEEQ